MNILRCGVLFLLSLFGLRPCPAQFPGPVPDPLGAGVRRVARVDGDRQASAVLVYRSPGSWHWATSCHVVARNSNLVLRIPDLKESIPTAAIAVKLDKTCDLAILSVKDEAISPQVQGYLLALPVPTDPALLADLERGRVIDGVVTIGFPDHNPTQPHPVHGFLQPDYVSDIIRPDGKEPVRWGALVNNETSPGMSGGGVFTASGVVIGIHGYRMPDKHSYFTKISDVRRLLEASSDSIDVAAAAERARDPSTPGPVEWVPRPELGVLQEQSSYHTLNAMVWRDWTAWQGAGAIAAFRRSFGFAALRVRQPAEGNELQLRRLDRGANAVTLALNGRVLGGLKVESPLVLGSKNLMPGRNILVISVAGDDAGSELLSMLSDNGFELQLRQQDAPAYVLRRSLPRFLRAYSVLLAIDVPVEQGAQVRLLGFTVDASRIAPALGLHAFDIPVNSTDRSTGSSIKAALRLDWATDEGCPLHVTPDGEVAAKYRATFRVDAARMGTPVGFVDLSPIAEKRCSAEFLLRLARAHDGRALAYPVLDKLDLSLDASIPFLEIGDAKVTLDVSGLLVEGLTQYVNNTWLRPQEPRLLTTVPPGFSVDELLSALAACEAKVSKAEDGSLIVSWRPQGSDVAHVLAQNSIGALLIERRLSVGAAPPTISVRLGLQLMRSQEQPLSDRRDVTTAIEPRVSVDLSGTIDLGVALFGGKTASFEINGKSEAAGWALPKTPIAARAPSLTFGALTFSDVELSGVLLVPTHEGAHVEFAPDGGTLRAAEVNLGTVRLKGLEFSGVKLEAGDLVIERGAAELHAPGGIRTRVTFEVRTRIKTSGEPPKFRIGWQLADGAGGLQVGCADSDVQVTGQIDGLKVAGLADALRTQYLAELGMGNERSQGFDSLDIDLLSRTVSGRIWIRNRHVWPNFFGQHVVVYDHTVRVPFSRTLP